jgi:phosphohistidine phosphatase SixA
MIVVAITHADAKGPAGAKGPIPDRRALTELGAEQVWQAADRLFAEMKKKDSKLHSLHSQEVMIQNIVSSPAARCVSTAALLADAMHQYVKTSEIHLSGRLLQTPGRQLKMGDLCDALSHAKAGATILCTHSDLLGVLPDQKRYDALRDPKDSNFFASKPAIVIFEYEDCAMNVLLCEMLVGGSWLSA